MLAFFPAGTTSRPARLSQIEVNSPFSSSRTRKNAFSISPAETRSAAGCGTAVSRRANSFQPFAGTWSAWKTASPPPILWQGCSVTLPSAFASRTAGRPHESGTRNVTTPSESNPSGLKTATPGSFASTRETMSSSAFRTRPPTSAASFSYSARESS